MNFEAAGCCSTSLESTQPCGYHVFMSYRGDDIRGDFADHFYNGLTQKGLITFRDGEEIYGGDMISDRLFEGIKQSLSAVVILSKNYASSTWCLDELQKILQCRNEMGLEVFPVFYGVNPSDVRHQRRSFSMSFRTLKKRFREDEEKVQRWRNALREIAGLAGWNSEDYQYETKLIEDIVESIWTKLQPKLPIIDMDGLVGIDGKMQRMYSILELESNDVLFIGIWGMAGIGKTTFARVVYHKIRNNFEVCCFVANVREFCDRKGLIKLQMLFLSRLKIKNMQIDDELEGKKLISSLMSTKKVLLVLDDISDEKEVEHLAGSGKWFAKGSRVIVTTRENPLSYGKFRTYELENLSPEESFELFCKKVFNGNHPEGAFYKLSKTVVQYSGNLPLAVEELGAIFRRATTLTEWQDTILRIQRVVPETIRDRLRISFKRLERVDQTVFLYIACFFKGVNKDRVIQILDACGLQPASSIKVLIDKSLITFDGVRLGMHVLTQKMGKYIVNEECGDDCGKHSMLWTKENIDAVLRENKGTEAIRGIVLKLPEPYEAKWDPSAFSKIPGLVLLIISSELRLPRGLNCLPRALKVLVWNSCPLSSLPLDVPLNELVILEMPNSKMSKPWSGLQFFNSLKSLKLSHSIYLIQTPNFKGVPNLESLDLEGCINLGEIHPSLGMLEKLVILNLKGCENLQMLPEFDERMKCLSIIDLTGCKKLACLPNTFNNLASLKSLNLSGCSKFSRLPSNLNENMALEELDFSDTAIREVPTSIGGLPNLKVLSFRGCKAPPSISWKSYISFSWLFGRQQVQIPMGLRLPPSFSGLSSLQKLDLSYCDLHDESIPSDFGSLTSLEILDLSGNNFVHFPVDSISNLLQLRSLKFDCCPRLQSLPRIPPNVETVHTWNCPLL